jgi:hypothetical protein
MLLAPAVDGKLPTTAVGVVNPEPHVRRAGRFRADLIARILQVSLDSLEVLKRLLK